MAQFGGRLSKLMQLKHIIAVLGGIALSRWAIFVRIFVIFREKIAILTSFESHFARF